MPLKKVLVESPFAGKGETEEERLADMEANITYARHCLNDCFQRDEAPYASHLLYPQEGILDDDDPEERQLGIDAGLLWGVEAEDTVVYLDRGFSTGMRYGLLRAIEIGRPFHLRVHPDYQDHSWIKIVHRMMFKTLLPILDWEENMHKYVTGLSEFIEHMPEEHREEGIPPIVNLLDYFNAHYPRSQWQEDQPE
jgi:hypothetical protein